jgi:hypothetical protein
MTLASIRPRLAEMRFQLLGRNVHPELFQIYKCHQIQRDNYQARICINSDGHYITWKSGSTIITEIVAAATQPLPGGARMLDLPLSQQRPEALEYQGCSYHYQFQLERVSAEIFWMIHQQLSQSASNHELIQIFNSSGRLPIGGLSFIHVESRLRVLRIQAIHTFPDDYVLVKTQSSFASAAGKAAL